MIYKDYGNTYTVYMLIFPDGKRYVGLTRQKPEKRWRCGQGYRNQTLVYKAIQEAGGWEKVKHEVVVENVSIEVGKEKEKELIKKYHTQDFEYGYNTKNGGQTFGEHSQEFLDALHNRMVGNTYCVGRKISEKHLQALIEGNKRSTKPRGKHRKPMTDEQKKILSEKAIARWNDPKRREIYMQGLSKKEQSGKNNPMYGKKHSDETKRKISEKAKGRTASKETREKLSAAFSKKVIQYDLHGNILKEYPSIKIAAETIGKPGTNISFCCKNNNRTCGGYKWRYADDLT